MRAVIDRFEGNFAVLILEGGQKRINVPRLSLPIKSREGSWLQVVIEDGELRNAVLDEEETAQAEARIAEKLARLRRGEHRKKR